MRPGARNAITDVDGILVGQAHDARRRTGVSVVTADAPFVAGVHVMGGAPGTRDTDALAPDRLVTAVDAIVLAGGSAFGLDAAGGVMDALAARGRGFAVGAARVPIVPAAIVFDLLNGGDKDWTRNPYRELGAAAMDALRTDVEIGSAGAGYGATTATLRGGTGTASAKLASGHTVGALVIVNAVGNAVGPRGHFHAAPFEIEAEFGGRGPDRSPDPMCLPPVKGGSHEATTIAIVATDARLDKPAATRMAVAAHDGIGRAVIPAHTPFDGDLVFAAATGRNAANVDPLWLGHAAAVCLARAIARGVYSAQHDPEFPLPAWSGQFG